MSQQQAEQKMLRARDLIRNKRFAEARALLKTTTHPKAASWLKKLDAIDPPNRSAPPSPMQQTREHGAVSAKQSRMAEPAKPYPSETIKPRGSKSVSLDTRRRAKTRPARRSNTLRNFLLFFVVIIFFGIVGAGAYFVILPQLDLDLNLPGLAIGGGATENLAGQFPADTVVYARLRTDDAYIQQLDTLQIFESVSVAGMPDNITIAGFLDMGIGQLVPGETFATAIRPWLGDNMAVGLFNADVLFDAVFDNDAQAGIAAVIQIQSKAEAMAFFDKIAQGAIIPTEENGYTVYMREPAPSAPIILLNDSQMIITTSAGRAAMTTADGAKLNSVAAFNETTAMLPAAAYNILVYTDTGTIQRGMFNSISGTLPAEQQPLMNAIVDFVGQQAIGFTNEAEHSLIIDVVQQAGDATALRNQGISLTGASSPVNTALLNRIPANTGFMLAGSDVRSLYNLIIDNVGAVATIQGEDPRTVEAALSDISGALEGFGLNLENDVLSWLTGTFAIYTVYDIPQPGTPSVTSAALYPDTPYALNVNGALMIEATDAAKAKNVVEVLATQLIDAGAPIVREDISGANTIVLAIPDPQFTAPVEIVIGANDAVFVIGTRAAVTPALVGDGNFAGSAGYTQAATYLLSDANTVWYMDTQGATLLADAMSLVNVQAGNVFGEITASFSGEEGTFDAPSLDAQQEFYLVAQQEYRAIANRLASSSISSTGDVDANSVIRLVLTLKP